MIRLTHREGDRQPPLSRPSAAFTNKAFYNDKKRDPNASDHANKQRHGLLQLCHGPSRSATIGPHRQHGGAEFNLAAGLSPTGGFPQRHRTFYALT